MAISYRLAARPIPQKAKPVKAKDYLAFIHQLPCVVTGERPVEAAHLSAAAPEWCHFGRGKTQKASDRWALPLHPDKHRESHAGNEMAWWKAQGIDPHRLATILYALWCERGDEAAELAVKIIRSQR